jgi:hypothetical protein
VYFNGSRDALEQERQGICENDVCSGGVGRRGGVDRLLQVLLGRIGNLGAEILSKSAEAFVVKVDKREDL